MYIYILLLLIIYINAARVLSSSPLLFSFRFASDCCLPKTRLPGPVSNNVTTKFILAGVFAPSRDDRGTLGRALGKNERGARDYELSKRRGDPIISRIRGQFPSSIFPFFFFYFFLLPLMSVILLLKGLKGFKPNMGACKPFMTRASALSVRVFSAALYHFAFTRVKAI